MGTSARKRQVVGNELVYAIQEPLGSYSSIFDAEMAGLSPPNGVTWDENGVASVGYDGPTP
jgi:hypothetical protein